jgi:sugar/nucleoside kinase (ribokinase family)
MRCGLVVIGNTSRDTVKYQTISRGPFFGGGGLNVAIAESSAGIFPKLVSVIGC